MRRDMLLGFVVVFGVFAMAGAPLVQAEGAKRVKACEEEEIPVADERGGGYVFCLPSAEWEKAVEICGKVGEDVDPMSCICQDGDSIGACGDEPQEGSQEEPQEESQQEQKDQ